MLFAALSIFILLTLVVLAMAIGQLFFYKEEVSVVKSRVQRLSQVPEELRGEFVIPDEAAPKKSVLSDIDLKPLLGKLTGDAYFTHMEEELARADIPLRVSEFLIFRAVFVILGVAIGFFIFKNIGLALLMGIPFALLHLPYILIKKKSRITKFGIQMADFLLLVVNSLRAGQTFLQGCQVAVGESEDPIAAEFKQVIKEVNLGLPEAESMENMLSRVPSEDLQIVVSAYIIQRKVGGNLAEILDTTAATVRERIKIKGMIDTLTTQGKISGALVGSLPFVIALAVSFINPGYMAPLLKTIPGYFVMAFALGLQATGAFIIYRIIDIEV
ncbi:MAG: type II secretion system F family protein [Blastochloris sp.]|nr:type II secretion system F family protein [Blastochloris sp.]